MPFLDQLNAVAGQLLTKNLGARRRLLGQNVEDAVAELAIEILVLRPTALELPRHSRDGLILTDFDHPQLVLPHQLVIFPRDMMMPRPLEGFTRRGIVVDDLDVIVDRTADRVRMRDDENRRMRPLATGQLVSEIAHLLDVLGLIPIELVGMETLHDTQRLDLATVLLGRRLRDSDKGFQRLLIAPHRRDAVSTLAAMAPPFAGIPTALLLVLDRVASVADLADVRDAHGRPCPAGRRSPPSASSTRYSCSSIAWSVAVSSSVETTSPALTLRIS